MKTMRCLPALLLLVGYVAALHLDKVHRSLDGRPRMTFGDLGSVEEISPSAALSFLSRPQIRAIWELTGEEKLAHRVTQKYFDKVRTLRFDQTLYGLEVEGGEIAVHITPGSKVVHGLTGNVLKSSTVPVPQEAIELGERLLTLRDFKPTSKPVLKYVIDENDVGRLAWVLRVLSSVLSEGTQQRQRPAWEPFVVYFDAISHEFFMYTAVHQKGLDRSVYTSHASTELPGTLVRSEGDPASSDSAVNQAYDNAGYCYEFYYNVFGRDSYDDQGAPLISSVHYDVAYNNAFWNGEQMVYGDGDGELFANFTDDLSVICHELTHAVTQSTSNLRYFKESGALNEGFSDIMGSSSVIYTENPRNERVDPATSWLIGANVTLMQLNPVGCPDCPLAIRFMNNPALDGSSSGFYPDRYTGFKDNGGVHLNSGIANLAYVLTIQGGTQPDNKSDQYVLPVGVTKSQQIYYLAFTQYLGHTSKFVDARVATIQAANVLYGGNQPVVDSTANAWTAVGVVEASS